MDFFFYPTVLLPVPPVHGHVTVDRLSVTQSRLQCRLMLFYWKPLDFSDGYGAIECHVYVQKIFLFHTAATLTSKVKGHTGTCVVQWLKSNVLIFKPMFYFDVRVLRKTICFDMVCSTFTSSLHTLRTPGRTEGEFPGTCLKLQQTFLRGSLMSPQREQTKCQMTSLRKTRRVSSTSLPV